MTQISSRWTLFYKRIFPVAWFSLMAVSIGGVTFSLLCGRCKTPGEVVILPILAMTLVMSFGYLLMKFLIFDLADEVFDCGDYLLVKQGKIERKIPLADIINVNYTPMMNPPRVTIQLLGTSATSSIEPRSGSHSRAATNEIAFITIRNFGLNPFRKNQVIEDLILRIHNARVKKFKAPF